MKFKKFILALLCVICAACVCATFAACGGDSTDNGDSGSTDNGDSGSTDSGNTGDATADPDANLADGTYVFYVYLDDGTTPVEGARIMICYNTSETTSTCSLNSALTDENGRAEIDLSSILKQYGSYNPDGLCIHFNETINLDTLIEEPEGFPEGYTYPADSQSIALNGAESEPYEYAWYITEQITTFKLVKVS